jgi:myosin heavy subunit
MVVTHNYQGAGKSEATKLILQFLADVSARSVAKGSTAASEAKGRSLESQVLAANPILEAFGNAKTLRNNNSSRFGKLITINFDQYGSIVGGGIINYLLEKSRVVGQTAGERNYHIFYQLLSSVKTESPLAKELQLQPAEYFNYTAKSLSTIEGVSDEEEFEEVQRSMDILQFSAEEKAEVFKVVAGVLHLGNLKFEGKHVANEDERAFVANADVVALASSMWGVAAEALETALISRNMATRDSISVRYNVSQAQDARDAMAKRVYAELFQLVVDKINLELGGAKLARQRFIGVLDIFGFESFEVTNAHC